MSLTTNFPSFIESFKKRINQIDVNSDTLRNALLRIGVRLQADIKIRIRSQHLIDTGNLLNSISYEIFRDGTSVGVNVGSYGVKYAAVHEFGYKGVVQVRAHARQGAPVKAHSRRVNIRQKKFIRDSLVKNRQFVLDTLRLAYMEG